MKVGRIRIIAVLCLLVMTAGSGLDAPTSTGASLPSEAYSPAAIAQLRAEFDAMIAAQPAGTFAIRVVDQNSRPLSQVPVWIDCEVLKASPVDALLSGQGPSELKRSTVLTDARGVVTFNPKKYRSLIMGVVGREVKLPFIIPAHGNDPNADLFQGLSSSADSEADIRAGRQAPRPNHYTAVVYRVEGPPQALWWSARKVVALQDQQEKPAQGFAPVPVIFFECYESFPRKVGYDWQRPLTPVLRQQRSADVLPRAHLLVHGGLLPSAMTGKAKVIGDEGQEKTPWWFDVESRGADVQVVPADERFPLVAPETGYRQSIRWEVPAQQGTVRQWLWIRLHGTPIRYGCWEMRAVREDFCRGPEMDAAAQARWKTRRGLGPQDPGPVPFVGQASITLAGPVYLNPTGSRKVERFLNSSQSQEWEYRLLSDPTKTTDGIPEPARVLFPPTPIDVTGVERLPMQTIVIAPPVPPAPRPPPLSPEEQAALEARLDAEELALQKAEYEAELAAAAAASASSAKP